MLLYKKSLLINKLIVILTGDYPMTASKWLGFETQETSLIIYTRAFNLIYNLDMASVYDENTVFKSGINSGAVNYMRVGRGSHNSDITILEFVHNVKKTGDHVDEAEIVGQVQISKDDLRNQIKLLQDRLEKLDV